MAFWTEIHWSEGMFLRPHHLQGAQRYLETVVRTSVEAVRPFAWGFYSLRVAKEPLENFTLRLDLCELRLKDGSWVRAPENTQIDPLNFKAAMDAGNNALDIYLGIPAMQEVRANSISLEAPESTEGSPRYEPVAIVKRDENTGANPQTLYVRRMNGRLFLGNEDMTGYETVRVCRVKRTDRAGAVPEIDELGAGPLLCVQADAGLSGLISSITDQIEAKGDILASEAKEHHMMFTDGVSANTEHLLKLHAINEVRAQTKALMQCPVIHPFDMFVALARLIGHLSVFHDQLVPGPLPQYDHDRPGASFDELKKRIGVLLDAMRPTSYVERPFVRKPDQQGRVGLEVELDRKWIDENADLFIALVCPDKDINELEKYIYGTTLNMKLASPIRAPRLANVAVRGLKLQIRSVPPGLLPRRQGLHYFKIEKLRGPDGVDYWKECESERGIRMTLIEAAVPTMEKLSPALYVPIKR